MSGNTTQETLDLVKASQQAPNAELAKAWTQSGSATTGITAYNLEAPAKKLYPVITPLRNRIPRINGGGGTQANWKAITGINTSKISAGVSQGNRGAAITTSTSDKNAVFRGIGLEDYVTFEADYSAQGFDDVKALAVEGLLRAVMIQEEALILGGNSSVALGTTPTPTTSTSTTGGSLAAATYNVICVAMTLEAYLRYSVSSGLEGQVSRTNTDGSVDTFGSGCARKSTAASQVTTGSTSTISASVAAVTGAVAYAWYWGTAGNELLGAITTINSVLISAAATGTQNASAMPATDYSQNSLVFDGMLSQIWSAGSGAYVKNLATGTAGTGTPLTSDSAGGIVEIDEALKSFWDNYRLSPTDIYVNAQELQNITKKTLAGSSTAAQRFTFNVDQGMISGGTMVRSYLNKFSMNGPVEIPIRLHPNLPPGTILFFCDQLPYPLSGVASVLRMLTRREYYQVEWPLRTRKYEYGVYADEVLQNYFPPAFGVISNIGNG